MDFSNINFNQLGSGLSGLFGGLFGNAGQPYEDYQKELNKYYGQAVGYQNPFFRAGRAAIPDFQYWLQGMKNPTDFINKTMSQYQESPWAKYEQDQAMRAGQNQGAASGLTGSTPLAQFMQQNAQNISSQDMQNWLANVLGVNTQYGQGQQNLMTTGQNAANALTGLAGQYGQALSGALGKQTAAEQNNRSNLWGGLFQTGAALAPLFF